MFLSLCKHQTEHINTEIEAGMWCLLQWSRQNSGKNSSCQSAGSLRRNTHTCIVGAHTANAHMQTHSNPSLHTHTLTHSLAQDAGKASRVLNEQTLTYGHQLTDLTDLTSASPFTSQWLIALQRSDSFLLLQMLIAGCTTQ